MNRGGWWRFKLGRTRHGFKWIWWVEVSESGHCVSPTVLKKLMELKDADD